MDAEQYLPIQLDLNDLKGVTEDLQSGLKRDSDTYKRTVMGIATQLNRLGRGVITKIDVTELQDQLGHLMYFDVKILDQPVPFDVENLIPLRAHFKNPSIIVLKRIRRYLMAAHRKVLARLEEEQAQERRLDFTSLNINTQIKKGMEEMQRLQTMASLTKTVSRRLDVLTKALHVPARFHADFKLVDRILSDPYHLRHNQAMNWINGSVYSGNLKVLRKYIHAGLDLLNKKSAEIFDLMEKISGIPFDRDVAGMDSSFNWYSLGTPLRRGEEFVRIFENEERIEQSIRRLTWFMVRSGYDANHYRELVDKYHPSERDRQENCTRLAKLYFEMDTRIIDSNRPGGDVQTAINTDISTGQLSEQEGEAAREWVRHNKTLLQELKLEIFKTLTEVTKMHPDVALPEKLEALMKVPEGNVSSGAAPKITILDLHREVELMEDQLPMADGNLLAKLIALRGRINERRAQLGHVEFHQQVREACADFGEYEDKLLEFDKAETRLDEMRLDVDRWILDCYREVTYADVDHSMVEAAFTVVLDNMLHQIKVLNYDVIDADRFKDYFDMALNMDHQQSLFQLDQLLHEVHSIPRQNQILPALADWESTLSRKEYEAKQTFILENELKLQTWVDEVRAELRERIAVSAIKPRRLRFEVFSLADCYAGNLQSLLHGLLRMAPLVASENEGERLIANISAIEAQIIEAQRITKPKGEAYDKLKELKRLRLLPDEILADLRVDIKENFADLDKLLRETNQGLERVRALQNRFGGSHDTSHLSVIINIHDLESLKSIYHFVDNITMTDIKRFGVIYKQKNNLMEDLYERANRKDTSVPPAIAKLITGKAYRQFKKNNVVPIPLKVQFLKEVPEILEFESELLIRTLNLVASEQIRSKAIYQGILRIVSMVKGANREQKLILRRIWMKFRSNVQAYKPRNFQINYNNNARALTIDVNDIVGHAFDDL